MYQPCSCKSQLTTTKGQRLYGHHGLEVGNWRGSLFIGTLGHRYRNGESAWMT